MFELWFYFFLEDGRLHPQIPARAEQVCYPERLPDYVLENLRLVPAKDEFVCEYAAFETKDACEFVAPHLLALRFSGYWNGAEGDPVYGVMWQCRKKDGKIS